MKTHKSSDFLGLAFVSALALLTCFFVFNNFVTQWGPMRWDEAEHAFTGLVFANDMLRLDFASLAGHAYEQVLWPFLHPLLLSLFFLAFGPTILTGKLFSLAMYFFFAVSMYFLGWAAVEKNKHISGVMCSAFALVTGSLYLAASEIMLEILALLFFTLCLALFLMSMKERKFLPLVAVFALLTFFSKTNFGIVLILSIVVFFAMRERFRIKKILANPKLKKILLPIAAVISLWLLIPPDRLIVFLGFLVNRPEGPPPLSIEGLSFYPLQLYNYSGPLLLLYALTAALSLRYMKNEKVRFLIVVLGLTILLNFFHQNKKMRFILYIYPPLFSLAAFHLNSLYAKIKIKQKQLLFFAAIGASIILFLVYASSSIRLYDSYYSVNEPLDFIKNGTMDARNIFVLGEFNEISPGIIEWHISNVTSIKNLKASSYSVWEFEDYSHLLKPLGVPDRISPERIADFIGKHEFDKIILIEPDNSSIFYNTEDFLVYNKWKLDYIAIVRENKDYAIHSSRYFDGIGVKITILQRSS